MKKLIVGIGIPGSGKTAVLKDFAERRGYAYVCPDDIRKEVTGDASDLSKDSLVWKEAYKRVEEQLQNGNSVIFDSTFTNDKSRKEFLGLGRKWGAEKIEGVLFDIPLELAKERNQNRERKVTEEVLEWMYKGLHKVPPEIAEGFDVIVKIDAGLALSEVESALNDL